jgi:poly(glycerol-phosphate) alpha-glucosyltransferase
MTLNLGVVTGSLSPAAGGLFQSVRLSTRALIESGANVTVYGLWDPQFDTSRQAWGETPIEVFPIRGPVRLGFSPGMFKSVTAAQHDVIHTHGIWFFPSCVTTAWRKIHDRPTIVSPRGMLDPWAIKSSRLTKRILRTLYEDRNLHGAAALHALNASEASAFRTFGLKNPIAVIPNGVDLPNDTRDYETPNWMAGDDRKVLLFLARFHPKKGLLELIEAWGLILRDTPHLAESWRLVIAGWDDGGHLKGLERKARENRLTHHVAFIGQLQGEAKSAALAHASAFILPSHSEGMPLSILEAWSWRLPVYMTAACNLPQGFRQGAAIEISNDPMSMAATLSATLNDSTQLAGLGAAGRALVEQHYTWDRVVADMHKLYSWVLNGGAAPDFIL